VPFWDEEGDFTTCQRRRAAAESAIGFRLNVNAFYDIEDFDVCINVRDVWGRVISAGSSYDAFMIVI